MTCCAAADQCTSEDTAQNFAIALHEYFAAAIKGVSVHNVEAYMEQDGEPQIHFDLNRVLSGYDVMLVCPEVRSPGFRVDIELNFMRDGLGPDAKEWTVVLGFEDDAEVLAVSADTLEYIVETIRRKASSVHAGMMKRIGMDKALATSIAQNAWQ